MRSIVLNLLLTLAVVSASQSYQLVWSDEFNGNTLDTTKWQYEVNCDGGGNNELQCYTSSSNNVVVTNGSLVITARQQDIGRGKKYTSGRINTKASAAWKYGRFDARAKTPNGMYLWPALWMMPRDNVYGTWAASGEIDIMENRGQFTSQQESTLHHGGQWPNNVYTGSSPQVQSFDMSADYHVYSSIWTPTEIQFLIDGRVYYSQTLQRNFWSGRGTNPYTADGQPFDQQFYYIINLAIGGGFFGGEANSLTSAIASKWSSPSLSVDYIRVYQLQDNPVNVGPAPVASAPVVSTSAVPTTSAIPKTSAAAVDTNAPAGIQCPVGVCGSSGCCYTSAGPSCYDKALYSRPVDGHTAKNSLCPLSFGSCNGACYNLNSYICSNGWLAPRPANANANPAPSTSSSKSTSSSASTSSSMSTTSKSSTSAAATVASSACPNGCGSGQCCNDSRNGGQCYSSSAYICINDSTGSHLCSLGSGYCSGGCYDSSFYKCVNNQLQPK